MDKKSALLALGQRIKSARRENSITQEELASALGVSGITISRWETGKQSPDYITLKEIASILGAPLSCLTEEPSVRGGEGRSLYADNGFRSLKKSNVAADLDHMLRDIAHLNPDVVVMIHELKEAWDELDLSAKQILADGLAFVLGSVKITLPRKKRKNEA